MNLTVNGQACEVADGATGADLLRQLGIPLATVVAELNGRIVPRQEFAEAQLADGDSLELVTIVGGG